MRTLPLSGRALAHPGGFRADAAANRPFPRCHPSERPDDAYATGQVLYTLRGLGASVTDPALRRGASLLVNNQRVDGTWHVRSRALKLQPYFESGFPYGDDQWISHTATAWAVMGLAAAGDIDSAAARR